MPKSRSQEMVKGYQAMLYQTEVVERERQGIIAELETFRSKIVGAYPGSFSENLRKFEEGGDPGARRLLDGGLRVLETPAYFSCTYMLFYFYIFCVNFRSSMINFIRETTNWQRKTRNGQFYGIKLLVVRRKRQKPLFARFIAKF